MQGCAEFAQRLRQDIAAAREAAGRTGAEQHDAGTVEQGCPRCPVGTIACSEEGKVALASSGNRGPSRGTGVRPRAHKCAAEGACVGQIERIPPAIRVALRGIDLKGHR